MFPFIASIVLVSLYVTYKLFDKFYVNLLLNIYLMVVNVYSLSLLSKPLFYLLYKLAFRKDEKSLSKRTFTIPYITNNSIELDWVSGIAFFVSFCINLWYLFTRNWVLNNIIALSMSIQSISFVSIQKYKNACLLLIGLLIYDNVWVFGTDAMVSVAKSLDGPVKILFPKDFSSVSAHHSMLGLGDIVIPGWFLAFLCRYDHFRSTNNNNNNNSIIRMLFVGPYFIATLVGYSLSLMVTMFFVSFFRRAQPALLYLVPGCLLTSLVISLALKDMKGLLNFSEGMPEKKEEKKTK